MNNIFLLSWDNTGLETIINVTQLEKEKMWAALQDQKSPNINHIVGSLMMRARYNPQRHYEIYTVTVNDSITEEDLRTMFDNDPQASADLIRERGNKVYIKYVLKKEDIMTFVSGLHELQEDLIEASVRSKEAQGFPEATAVIDHIRSL
mgnify:CR=1 FL=1